MDCPKANCNGTVFYVQRVFEYWDIAIDDDGDVVPSSLEDSMTDDTADPRLECDSCNDAFTEDALLAKDKENV